MKVYQKILLGIAAGTLFGLLLGPQSLLLKKDTVHVVDPSRVELQAALGDPASKIRLPRSATTNFALVGEHSVGKAGAGKAGRNLWYEVKFTLTAKMLTGGGVPALEGKRPALGETRRAFLRAADAPPPSSGLGHRIAAFIGPIGEIFLRLILMLVVPLVFTTLTVGTASLGNVRSLERFGLRVLVYFLLTTAVGTAIGMALALLMGPGRGIVPTEAALLAEQFNFLVSDATSQVQKAPDLVTFLVQIVPDNPLHSMASAQPNMLQVMFFSIMFGVALTLLPESRSRQVLHLLDKTSKALVMVMHMVMAVAPFGVAALIAQTVGATGYRIFGPLGSYLLLVVVGLAIHAALSTLVARRAGVSPQDFWRAIRPAELLGLGTSSSTATLPVSLAVAEDNLGLSPKLSSFTLTLGSSVNMPGTALFQAAALVFIAQAFGVELPLATLATAFVTIILLAVGTAAAPSAGVVSLALVLAGVGIPPVGIGLVVGFDRLLDMLRTPVNLAADFAGALWVAHATGETPQVLTDEEDLATTEYGFEGRLDREQAPYERRAREDR
ncbi:MAG: dicarboxylate/amino acid:cation symporter [Deltaproteobacteria bacterium]|nr:dicarboxylate/amino acid:cation symporter [Deltaproteobacteria bacterium]